jgi:hypothetical protein
MIRLDWLGMKYYWVRGLFIPIALCSMGVLSEATIIPLTALYMLSFSLNPFAVEEKGKLDNLYLTLPVSRKIIVNARFGLSLIMQAAGLIFGTVATIIISALLYGQNFLGLRTFQARFDTIFLLICASLLFYAIMHLSMFPVLFKLGYAKGKAFGLYIPIGALMVVFYAVFFLVLYNETVKQKLLAALVWSLGHVLWTSLILLAMAAAFFAASYGLSQRQYARRGF